MSRATFKYRFLLVASFNVVGVRIYCYLWSLLFIAKLTHCKLAGYAFVYSDAQTFFSDLIK